MTRRALSLLLVLAFGLTLAAPAQAQMGLLGPAGIIYYSNASQTIVNSAANTELLQVPIPVGLIATRAVSNATSTNFGTNAPIKLSMSGLLNTANGATAYLGVSYGGALATVMLLNGSQSLSAHTNIPIDITACFSAIATNTATPTNTNTVFLTARYATHSTTLTDQAQISSSVYGTTVLASSNNLNVGWQWGSAAQANRLTIHRTVVQIGACS